MIAAVIQAGSRSYYLTEFTDEVMPCVPSLEGWARYLAGNGQPEHALAEDYEENDRDTRFPHKGGETYQAFATLWQEDIVATRQADSAWQFSRPLGSECFAAVRYHQGLGWSADSIITPAFRFDPETREYGPCQTMEQALLAHLAEHTGDCADTEYVAVGTTEEGWLITFHAGSSPRCTATRSN